MVCPLWYIIVTWCCSSTCYWDIQFNKMLISQYSVYLTKKKRVCRQWSGLIPVLRSGMRSSNYRMFQLFSLRTQQMFVSLNIKWEHGSTRRDCVFSSKVFINDYLYTPVKTSHTVHPKSYAHGFCFAVLCCGYILTDFPISIRLTSLALWQSNDCPSASKATLINMDKYFMWIQYERLHYHNKAKHNETVCIFLGIYCTFYEKTLLLTMVLLFE